MACLCETRHQLCVRLDFRDHALAVRIKTSKHSALLHLTPCVLAPQAYQPPNCFRRKYELFGTREGEAATAVP